MKANSASVRQAKRSAGKRAASRVVSRAAVAGTASSRLATASRTIAARPAASPKTALASKLKVKYIYSFANGKAEGRADMKKLLGGKGANLAEMTNLGIPVPSGFTITTDACLKFYELGQRWPDGLDQELEQKIAWFEGVTQKGFGNPKSPLLVSVRSGAAVSMPGMMDTILNLGLNDRTAQGLIAKTSNPRFVYDAYRRFVQMYGDVVLHVEHKAFEQALTAKKAAHKVKLDNELPAEALKELVEEFKGIIRAHGQAFPDEPRQQLRGAINAVFASWNNDRAITYRKLHNIPDSLGTAVTIQAMVFGNMGSGSMTGVCFTRNPSTGEKQFYGEYLVNAQGEDVVAGIRTPLPIAKLKEASPKLYDQLAGLGYQLERYFREMQDLEFTVEEGKLFMLQCRSGKRTALAAVTIAVDFVEETLIARDEALLRVDPAQIDQLLHPTVDPKAKLKVIAKGLPASPGAAVGRVVFQAHRAVELAEEEAEKVILVRQETSPEDIGGMAAAQGILTARGGMTSHAAVVGRGMGKCCVVGCSEIVVREDEGRFEVGDVVVKEGDFISLNGTTGEVILGEVPLVEPQLSGSFKQLLEWADQTRRLGVRANGDTPQDAKVAREFGAEGIGLCRTEHMFFGDERLPAVREMIVAQEVTARKAALAKLLPFQKQDFIDIFQAMEGLPVTIRLLDPPLHEFLPHSDEEIARVAEQLRLSPQALRDTVERLREFNPMLGHRGCRLGITYPEINEMQAQAIFEAACELAKAGVRVVPEVMIPLVGHRQEFHVTKQVIDRVAEETMRRYGVTVSYRVGTMIEVPRAALVADAIAQEAEFFSFGTNDLTQMTFGFSRDDIGKFLPEYLKTGILQSDPFVKLDQEGVGALIRIAVQKGRSSRKALKVGICGEHGGEPTSIDFCHRAGLDYVSCSPYRVPVARLAAAQAAIREKK
ncbi:MAG: pyruvate, phosphate dikinase [Candidatus Omnitrophica bacterium]|nr:pyruvate, phosphate dikinase [Candidatus Omnitrophota bacterium]